MDTTSLKLAPVENDIRARYGIPGDAERVLIFSESSHWDPNWLYTSEKYYTELVESNLLQAIAELEREPRRVYSVECVFFLRMFWDRHPELHDTLRKLVKDSRLRMTSSGVSSADTLTPDAEALLRDLLLGQEWLRQNGLEVESNLAYFPDCFGHTPALPTLLNAAGFNLTAFARVDGMYGMAADYDPKSSYPRPGSTAEILLKREKTLDFIWRAVDGSQLLTHWNAYSYGQGDMIAYGGVMRIYIFPRFLYSENRSDRHVTRRIRRYIRELAPYSRTPYLFCPIGLDFNAPVPNLLELLDRYNQRHYPKTGVWVVNAGLEDYLTLVSCYQERLPVLELDPNPYWTGFYTSRPNLKKRSHDLLAQLLLAEQLSVSAGNPQETGRSHPEIDNAWWALATANHHDFITGTSPDSTVEAEQIPMLEKALQAVRPVVIQMKELAEPQLSPLERQEDTHTVSWQRQGDKIIVLTPTYGLEISASAGGCITRAWDAVSGEALLAGISNELLDYQESGGLWRMGMEYRGGKFKLAERSGAQSVQLEAQSLPEGVEVKYTLNLSGRPIRCAILCRESSPWIRFRISGRAAQGHTFCTRFCPGLAVAHLTMENPGGIAKRPLQKIYQPTFWPVQHFVHLQPDEGGRGLAFLYKLPGAAAYRPADQALELVAMRNATREKAYGFLPILATPASGHEKEDHTFLFALCFTPSDGWKENRLPQQAREYAVDPWLATEASVLYQRLRQQVFISSDQVWLEALKPAWRGEGLIARLCSYAPPSSAVTMGLRGWEIGEAYECDARERDIRLLDVQNGQVRLTLQKSITTLRLLERS